MSKPVSGRVWLHTHSNCPIFVCNIDFSFSFKEYLSSLNTAKLILKCCQYNDSDLMRLYYIQSEKRKRFTSSLPNKNDLFNLLLIDEIKLFSPAHKKSSTWIPIILISLFFLFYIKRAGSSFENVPSFSATNSQILEYHFNEVSHKPYHSYSISKYNFEDILLQEEI